MPRKIRQLKADLRKAGATQVSQVGSHTKWKHTLVPDKEVVIAGHDGDDAHSYQEKAVRELLDHIARAQEGGRT
jgi:predicted RNA binding protein YcfA (HicA-like mRNA interferase family)